MPRCDQAYRAPGSASVLRVAINCASDLAELRHAPLPALAVSPER